MSDRSRRGPGPGGAFGARAGVVVPVQVGCLVAERRTLVVSASETGGRKAARGSPPDQDFEPVDGLVHVVPAGVFEVEVPVTVVLGDNRPEPATETFSVSVELDSDSGSAGLRGTTTVVILDDEVYFDEIVTLETPTSMPEGDPPFGADCGAHLYRPLPDPCARGVPLLLTLNERFSQDLEFELYTLAETARADVDYQSIRGRRLVVREGHLVSFDVHEPLQLRVVPDLLPEPQEALSLFLYGRYPGNPVPAFAQRIRILIEDDDELAVGTDVPWFGPDAELCGDGESVLAVQEPSVTDGLGLFRVDLAYRVRRRSEADAEAGQVNGLLSCDLPAAAAVEVRVDLVSPGLSNAGDAGLDVVLPDHSRRLVFYRGQPAPIELFVRGDGLPEGREELDLLLSTGAGRAYAAARRGRGLRGHGRGGPAAAPRRWCAPAACWARRSPTPSPRGSRARALRRARRSRTRARRCFRSGSPARCGRSGRCTLAARGRAAPAPAAPVRGASASARTRPTLPARWSAPAAWSRRWPSRATRSAGSSGDAPAAHRRGRCGCGVRPGPTATRPPAGPRCRPGS